VLEERTRGPLAVPEEREERAGGRAATQIRALRTGGREETRATTSGAASYCREDKGQRVMCHPR
jgi:hypothetical protein